MMRLGWSFLRSRALATLRIVLLVTLRIVFVHQGRSTPLSRGAGLRPGVHAGWVSANTYEPQARSTGLLAEMA